MQSRPLMYAALFALFATASASADGDKALQNVKGNVSYAAPRAAAKPLALNASIPLDDRDVAITGADSLAAIGLPDSSRVLVGASSRVQLGFFNQTSIATAHFVVYDGKIRFAVQHPAGARANYTFQTPVGTIGVRGTEGDIESDGSHLVVNVYEVCGSQPVVVTTSDGKQFQLVAGQSLAAQFINGIVRAKVQELTQQMIDQFSPDFGVPTSWDAAKGQIVAQAQSRASSAADSVTGGYGSQVMGAVGGLFKHSSTPTPSPSPASDTCTHG